MNAFSRTITTMGMVESLVYDGQVFIKHYEKTPTGYKGLDRAWEYEVLPDVLIDALENGDCLDVMNALDY